MDYSWPTKPASRSSLIKAEEHSFPLQTGTDIAPQTMDDQGFQADVCDIREAERIVRDSEYGQWAAKYHEACKRRDAECAEAEVGFDRAYEERVAERDQAWERGQSWLQRLSEQEQWQAAQNQQREECHQRASAECDRLVEEQEQSFIRWNGGPLEQHVRDSVLARLQRIVESGKLHMPSNHTTDNAEPVHLGFSASADTKPVEDRMTANENEQHTGHVDAEMLNQHHDGNQYLHDGRLTMTLPIRGAPSSSSATGGR